MRKVISIVLNNFKNDSRVLKECVSLKQAGYNVSVLALHDGQSDLKEYDQVEEIPVHRIILRSKNWSKVLFMQSFKYIEFLIRAVSECIGADILHCNDLNALPVGVCCKIITFGRVKVFYDAHELETEHAGEQTIFIHTASVVLERLCLKFVDRMVTVSDGIADEYVARYGIEKPALVYNAPRLYTGKRSNILRQDLGIDAGQKIFLYQGGLSDGRGIENMVEAFLQLRREDVALVLMGYGPLEEWVKKKSTGSRKIFFHEAVSPQVLLNYTSGADYGLCLYENVCLNNYYCAPNKLFEYTMSGLPVLVSNLYELSRLCTQYSFGVVVENNGTEGIMQAVEALMEMDDEKMRENARLFAEKFAWEKQEKVLLAEYSKL